MDPFCQQWGVRQRHHFLIHRSQFCAASSMQEVTQAVQCRAIMHMERIIAGLKGKLEVDSRAHRGDTYVLMQVPPYLSIPFSLAYSIPLFCG